MLMRKNVNNDESKDSPISDAKKKKMGCIKYKPLNLNWIIILLVYKSELFLICIKMCQAFLLIIRTF